ncbi:MAG TPA: HAD-IA family hydrolase [Candidatus Dormibacteraeota bacterium]|nr:HAD-IA family hydrolase [Candidatus Dormibacteraeota bacterium]
MSDTPIKAVVFDLLGVLITSQHPMGQPLLLELASSLRKAGYKIGILSNLQPSDQLQKDCAQLFEQFNVVIFSGETGLVKPDPESYISAAEQLGCRPEEVLMIDDAAENTEGAKRAGCQAILYRTESQLRSDLKASGLPLG